MNHDQILFMLDDAAFAEFTATFDTPQPERNEGLERLMAVRAPWTDDSER